MWKTDLKWSARVFCEEVWPILNEKIGGSLVPVEQITQSDFARDLDQCAGIDAWHIHDNGIRGLASRVQTANPERPFNTFTIRKSRDSGATTEYEKRLNALDSTLGWLYPHLTVQAYVTARDQGKLISFAVVRTEKLIRHIEANYEVIGTRRTSNAEFFWVTFKDIADYEYPERGDHD